jgi:hypothetical protein
MLSILGHAAFALGALISLLNVYLSFIRVPLLRWRGQDQRFVSGVPLVGSFLLVVSAVLLWKVRWLALSALGLATLDTGGLHGFVGTLAWEAIVGRWRGRSRRGLMRPGDAPCEEE